MRRPLGTLLRRRVYGRKRFEPAFRFLYRHAIAGLFTVGETFDGTGEAAVLDRLSSSLPAEPVILDVGANVGAYARVVLGRFPAVSLHCFEPAPGAFALLQEAFAGDPRVQLHPFGLSDTSRSTSIYSSGLAGDNLASLHPGRSSGDVSQPVEVRRLDEVAAELGIARIDFLKIDAEGHDLAVLAGAGELLERVDAIQFEFSDANVASRTFLHDFHVLLAGRFDLFRVLRDGVVPFGPYAASLEIFVGANYLALRRAETGKTS
jgi:FkbM family methyltransferase